MVTVESISSSLAALWQIIYQALKKQFTDKGYQLTENYFTDVEEYISQEKVSCFKKSHEVMFKSEHCNTFSFCIWHHATSSNKSKLMSSLVSSEKLTV